MADNSAIEWTDATWNIVTGCSVTSPGCTNCYAMKLAGTRLQHEESRAGLTIETKAGPVWNGTTRFNEQWLDQPLRWRRPRKVFVCAHGDLFHESVPDEWIDRVFAVMALCPQHTFQVLTKRSDRMRDYFTNPLRAGIVQTVVDNMESEDDCPFGDAHAPWVIDPWPLPNVWLGVSVEDQQRADERIPDLLATPAAVRWISAEPLLGPVDLESIRCDGWVIKALSGGIYRPFGATWGQHTRLDWVVAGGESGPGARPMHPDWARSLRDQCAAAGVPFLFKQWGDWAPLGDVDQAIGKPAADLMADGLRVVHPNPGTTPLVRIGKKAAGRLLDGVQHDGYPEARHG